MVTIPKCNIILEGMDRSGKSTLARALVQHLDASYEHDLAIKDRQEAIAHYAKWMDRVWRNQGFAIWDRSFIGEIVYAPIYRPENCCDSYPNRLQYQFDDKPHYCLPVFVIWVRAHKWFMQEDVDRINKNYDYEFSRYDWTMRTLVRLPVHTLWTTHTENGFRPVDELVIEVMKWIADEVELERKRWFK